MKKTRLTTNWRYLPLLIIMLLSSKVVLSVTLGDLSPGQQIQAELLASQLGLDTGVLMGTQEIQKPTIKESLPPPPAKNPISKA